MLLRSSSTPVPGSLLSSFSDFLNKDFESTPNSTHPSSTSDHHLSNITFTSHGVGGQTNLTSQDSNSTTSRSSSLRRAHSEENLQSLLAPTQVDDSSNPPRPLRRVNDSMLHTTPSFSIYNSTTGYEGEGEEEEEEERDGVLERAVTIGENIMSVGSIGDFCFRKEMIEEEDEGVEENEQGLQHMSSPLFLARGLGIDVSCGGGGGGDFRFNGFDKGGGGGDESNMEEYYKRMVEENPCSPLFLRNYAHFLYQAKGDLRGAEEYYSRAILSDPGDGDILSKYAKILWELHDLERASSYFERAVQVAPEDSYVHAAYASFLWETEDEEEEDRLREDLI